MSELYWNNVNFILTQSNGQQRYLLSNMSGIVKEKQFVGILGPTGSGKTCLLNALSGRVQYSKKLKLEGVIQFDGYPVDSYEFKSNVGYVMQEDGLFSYLSVRETLTLAAYFYTADKVLSNEMNSRITALIRELGLSKAENTIIGSATRRGVSGGERKRTAIGKELLSNPKLLFLDEPTSNLDSFQAQNIIQTLKDLALRGHLVISVIHQPRSSIFAMFDILMILSEGKVIYYGPAEAALHYFHSMGHICPSHFNPADFFLDTVSLDTRTVEAEKATKSTIKVFAEHWENQPEAIKLNCRDYYQVVNKCYDIIDRRNINLHLSQRTNQNIDIVSYEESKELDNSIVRSVKNDKLTSSFSRIQSFRIWMVSFYLLSWRANAEIYRNYGSLIIRTCTNLFMAALLALIYHSIGYSQTNIQDRIGILYFITVNQSFSPLIGVLSVFPNEKRIISQELTNQSYSTSSYFSSRVVAELPGVIILTTTFSSIVYWSVNLNPNPICFLIFVGVVNLETFCAVATGFAISAMSPNAVIASALGPPILIVFLLFSGFYINTSSLPVGSFWVTYISYVKWAFQALVINEFEGEKFECTALSCESTGSDVIARLAFNDYSLQFCVLCLFLIMIGLLVIAYISLIYNRERFLKVDNPEIDNLAGISSSKILQEAITNEESKNVNEI